MNRRAKHDPRIPAPPMPFEALTADAYRQFEHAASLKGLLKPFKGKGELEHLAQVAREIEAQLCELMEAVVQQAGHPLTHCWISDWCCRTPALAAPFCVGAPVTLPAWGCRSGSARSNTALPPVVREGLPFRMRPHCTEPANERGAFAVPPGQTCAIKMASAERLLRQFTTAVDVSR